MKGWTVFKHNLYQLLVVLDQVLCVIICLILFETAWADETLSCRAWRWEKDGVRSWPRVILDFIAKLLGDPNHCFESYESERLGRQLPPELRYEADDIRACTQYRKRFKKGHNRILH